MSRVYYNKLIRDLIYNKIKKNGENCEVREMKDKKEFQQELLKKVSEESGALSRVKNREEFLDEYADLMEVLEELISLNKYSKKEIEEARKINKNKKGGFKKRLFLHWSDHGSYKSNETPQGIRDEKKNKKQK